MRLTAALCAIAGLAVCTASAQTVTTYADQDQNGNGGPTLGSGKTVTAQQSGPRTGTSGTRFFNVEGRGNGSFASWGAIRFDLTELYSFLNAEAIDDGFGAGDWRVTAVDLVLTQNNASFTTNGGPLEIYHAADDSVPVSQSNGNLRIGSTLGGNRMYNGSLGAVTLLASGNFVETATGDGDIFNIDSVIGIGSEFTLADNQLTFVIDTNNNPVAATYKGEDSPFNGINAPALVIQYVIEQQMEEFIGACCTLGPDNLPSCEDDVNADNCGGADQTFFNDQLCADVSCPIPSGACCLESGSCEVRPADQCVDPNTFFVGEDCLSITCPGCYATFADWPDGTDNHLATAGSGFTATIRPSGGEDGGGSRPGPNGARFFTVEGPGNGTFASLGAVKFVLRSSVDGEGFAQDYLYDLLDAEAVNQGFSAGDWTIVSAELQLFQSNFGATTNGGPIDIFHASDPDEVNINVEDQFIGSGPFSSPNPNAFAWDLSLVGPSDYMFDGYGSSNPFGDLTGPLASRNFVETSTGDTDSYPLAANAALLGDLNNQSDGTILFIVDTLGSDVVASYKGSASPFNGVNAPRLLVKAEFGDDGVIRGACCVDFVCTDFVEEGDCDGSFFADQDCVDEPCNQIGACCVDLVCTENVLSTDCDGLFRSGENCDLVTCCDDGATACCDPQFGCVQGDDQQTCEDFGGVFYPRGDCSVDNNDNGEADLCEGISPCPPADMGVEGDANGDGMVTIADVLFIIARFGDPAPSDADVNGDGMVTIADVLFTIARFGN